MAKIKSLFVLFNFSLLRAVLVFSWVNSANHFRRQHYHLAAGSGGLEILDVYTVNTVHSYFADVAVRGYKYSKTNLA